MARLAGYGVVLVPYGQYTFARSDAAPHAVLVTNWREDGPATALVDPADPQSAPGIVDVAPGPDVLIGVGQTVTDRRTMGDGVQVIEVTYQHEGDPWWQAHYLLPRQKGRVLVFTAQSREPGIAATREGLEWMLALD
ncbi:hypothetical protein ADL15_32985 [Actinoplanes awajinensis subsp. mycoplanecinus]|uniref:Uncharacterized protein n=1 Tax=Actinoplanes awajinensis subsp. mycoplanecinus TaxID=135947 RepID=A0A101JJK7_9ACTN|nr:hypothetical protein ADL15_32985 [Actinoplanes awajinensis subsp. mycoplanecinus]